MNWYEEAFTKNYLDVYAHRDEKQAEVEVSFAIKALQISAEHIVLDLCCGAGRHSFYLAEIAKIVVAYDLSIDLLNAGIQNNLKKGFDNILWQKGDMLTLGYIDTFHTITSFFNSFGYFEQEHENFKVLENIYRALKNEGRLLLDIMNKSYIIKNLKGATERVVNGYQVKEERWLSTQKDRVYKKVEIKAASGEKQEYCESVKLYAQEEIKAILKEVGFLDFSFYGGVEGEPFFENSTRLFITVRK